MNIDGLLQAFEKLSPRTEAELLDWQHEHEVIPLLKKGGFDERFFRRLKMSIEQERVLKVCRKKLIQTGAIIVLAGTRGAGKTSLAAHLAQERAANEQGCPWNRLTIYRRLSELISAFKPLYADFGTINHDGLVKQRDALCTWYDLAVLDEVHEADDQKLKNKILTDFIDRRYASRKDTILISNQEIGDFEKTTSDSILSRIAEHGQIIPCKWDSFRKPL